MKDNNGWPGFEEQGLYYARALKMLCLALILSSFYGLQFLLGWVAVEESSTQVNTG